MSTMPDPLVLGCWDLYRGSVRALPMDTHKLSMALGKRIKTLGASLGDREMILSMPPILSIGTWVNPIGDSVCLLMMCIPCTCHTTRVGRGLQERLINPRPG